ncbi:MAG TPA: hypothetical protein VGQ83_01915 [Polyangia bacterium]
MTARPGRRVLAVVAALLLCAAARPAVAVDLSLRDEPLRLDVTETLLFSWHLDNMNRTYADDRYGEVQSRLNLALAYRRWLFSVRVDTSGYFNTPSCDAAGNCTAPSPPDHADRWPALSPGDLRNRYEFRGVDHSGPMYLPERLALTYAGPGLEVTLGDHYVSLGRGLVLSLRKVDELGSDTDLRGGRVVVRRGPFSGTVVGGVTNIVNIDEATGRTAPDPLDGIVGGRAEVRLRDTLALAAQGAAIIFHEKAVPNAATDDMTLLGGASAELPRLGTLGSGYVEYAHASRVLNQVGYPGDALYGALTTYRGRLSLLLEGKYYSGFPSVGTSLKNANEFSTIRYNNPPTVERVLAEMDSVSPILYVGGGRLRADYKLSSAVTGFASYGYFYDWTDPNARLDIHDPYAGVTVAWQEHRSHLAVSGGVRYARERENTDPSYAHPAQAHSTDAHFELVVAQALTRRLSLELGGRHRYRQKRLFELDRWNEGEWALGLRWSPRLIAAVGYEYTTEPALERPPCCDPATNPGACYQGQTLCDNYHRLGYVNGQIAWTFRPGSTVRLFVGGQRGGLRCVSGVCRQFPPFQGLKAEATIRF